MVRVCISRPAPKGGSSNFIQGTLYQLQSLFAQDDRWRQKDPSPGKNKTGFGESSSHHGAARLLRSEWWPSMLAPSSSQS